LNPGVAAAEAEAFAERQSEHLERIAYYDETVPRRSEQALLRLNRRIRANGGTLILVVPPMTEAVRSATERKLGAQVRGFEALTTRLAAEGVVVSDHWRDPVFATRYDLFVDNQHLNGAGAAVFSRTLATELRARGIFPQTGCGGARITDLSGFPTTSGHEMVDDVR
jgi:hypothetical protein